MRPSDAYPYVRANPIPRIAQDQIERRIDHEQIGAAGLVVAPIGGVGKGDRRAMHVGINLKAHHATQCGWKESDLQPSPEALLNRGGNRRPLIENILIAWPTAHRICAHFHVSEIGRYGHVCYAQAADEHTGQSDESREGIESHGSRREDKEKMKGPSGGPPEGPFHDHYKRLITTNDRAPFAVDAQDVLGIVVN